jgi:signal transduction histidine kinase
MQFNYIVSHNLRSPVANILGMVEVLRLPEMTEEDKESCIDHIFTAVNRMDYVIKDLNAILETRSALNEKKEPVSLLLVLENLKATLQKQIDDSGTELHIRIGEDAESLFTIRGYLESILYNLISNAIKYKSAERRPVIEFVTRRRDDAVWITVTDNGVGIDLKKFGKQVFGLYKRFNTDVEGKGLGLYMTRTQVETLGGKISVHSTPDNGSTFTVQLPMS